MELKEIEEQVRRVVTANPVEMTVEYVIELLVNTHNAALEKAEENAEIIYGDGIAPFLNKQSIRKLKIPTK